MDLLGKQELCADVLPLYLPTRLFGYTRANSTERNAYLGDIINGANDKVKTLFCKSRSLRSSSVASVESVESAHIKAKASST